LQDQGQALDMLVRENLSRGPTLAFLLCAGVVTLVAGLVPMMVMDAAGSASGDTTDVAVASVLGLLLLARYGAEGYPHGRFFYSVLVLTLALILTAGVLADWSDPSALGLLPCLVVAGLFACSTIRKYAARYGWAVRERVIRARARRREAHRTQIVQAASRAESPKTDLSGMHIHPAVLYAALFDPAVIVTVVFVAARPQDAPVSP
jgi:peptidoglycan/LPS O-acetylase OafA/YrhL